MPESVAAAPLSRLRSRGRTTERQATESGDTTHYASNKNEGRRLVKPIGQFVKHADSNAAANARIRVSLPRPAGSARRSAPAGRPASMGRRTRRSHMSPSRIAAAVILGAALTCSARTLARSDDPIRFPAEFREWAHVKSVLVGPEAPSFPTEGGIHHIYANPKALDGYRTGRFPEGSVVVYNLLETTDSQRPHSRRTGPPPGRHGERQPAVPRDWGLGLRPVQGRQSTGWRVEP